MAPKEPYFPGIQALIQFESHSPYKMTQWAPSAVKLTIQLTDLGWLFTS